MTKSVDHRMVEMEFKNAQFEKGISTSLKSLEKLKKGLSLDKMANSLASLEKAGRGFSLVGISDTLDHISNKFSAMGIIGITTLQNLTNAALNAGKNFVKALTIDPIKTGLEEYETKMNAITTIMTNTASKGTTLEDVNKTLNELNKYADLTIYNFAEMTKNIGTFTAAGIGLERSATAIKGIANLGAGSGSTPLQVSTAMYQLSQALASGKMNLVDWNSVVNAGMGGELFKNALLKTAKQMGIFVDESIPFRETLQDDWLTSEVLIKTLEGFANDEMLVKAATQVKTLTQLLDTMKESVQSGWAQTWENIIGDREEAAAFFTSINDGFGEIVGASAEARNKMLAFWKANGGRDAVIKGLANSFKYLQSVLKPIGEAFREIFPSLTGDQLVKMSKNFLDLTEKFKIGKTTADNLKRSFKGLFALFDIGKQIISALLKLFSAIVSPMFSVNSSFLSFTGTVGDFIVAIDEALKSSKAFTKIVELISGVIIPLANAIRIVMTSLFDTLSSLAVIDMSGFEEFSKKMQMTIKPFEILSTIVEYMGITFGNLANVIGKAFDALRQFIMSSFTLTDFNLLFDAINSGLFAAILISLKKFIDTLTMTTKRISGIFGGVTETLDGVVGSLKAMQASLKAGVLMKIAISMAILAGALLILSRIDSKKLTTSLGAITALFVELFASMTLFDVIMGPSGLITMFKITTGMIGLSIAVLILASAMKKLSKLDWGEVAKGLAAIAGLALILIGSTKLLDASSGMMIRASVGFILFGVAINILSKAVEKLGGFDTGKLIKGLVGVGVLVTTLALFMNTANLSGLGIVKSVGILILAGAITVLASSVEKLSKIDMAKLLKGLGGLAIILTEVVVFSKFVNNPLLIATAVGLTILSGAILLLTKAIINLGNMKWSEVAKGLTAIGGVLAAIVLTMMFLPKGMFLKSLVLLDVAGALVIISQALTKMGKLSWDEIARSLTALGVSIGLIVGMFVVLQKSDLVDSTAFLILTVGITLLAEALKKLGSMSLAQIGVALLGLAGGLAIIGGAAVLLTPLIPAIFGLSVALTVFGVAVLALGAGVALLSIGLTGLAAAGIGASVTIVAIVTSIAGLIPFVFKTIAQGIIDFAKLLATGAKEFVDAASIIAIEVINGISKLLPKLLDIAIKLLVGILTTIEKYTPKIVDSGLKIIISFLKGIAEHIEEVVAVGVTIVVNFIKGLASKLPDLIKAAFSLMVAFINGLADAVEENTPIVLGAVVRLMLAIPKAVLEMISEVITDFFGIGENIVRGMIEGIESMIGEVSRVVGDIATSIVDTAKNVLGIHSPSDVFKDEIGAMVGEGTAIGIIKSGKKAVAATEQMAKAVGKTGKEAFDKAVEWIDDQKYFNAMSLEEELACWQALQNKYIEGTEERKKADREYHRVWKEIYRSEFDHSVKWINDRKYYNELSLSEELEAWKRVQKRYFQGTKEREDADKEVYRLEKEINTKRKDLEDEYYAKTKEVNDKLKQDIQDVTAEYEDAVKTRADSLYSAYGLFDKVEKEKKVSGDQLIRNLQSQVKAFQSWQQNINNLARKGIDSGLIEELRNMGPQAASQIAALNALSSDKLNTYVALWRERHSDAKEQATSELESMRQNMVSKIQELTRNAEVELNDYKYVWLEQMSAINADAGKQLSILQSTMATGVQTVTTNAETEIASMGDNITTSVASTRTEVEQEFVTLADRIQAIMKSPNWVSLGVNIIEGMMQGIRSKSEDLAKEAARTALMALSSAKFALGIRSPSKAFTELGVYTIEGFVIGLQKTSEVISSAKNVGKVAVNSLKNALMNAADMVNGDLDLAPTIRPVLDLSDVEAGKNRLNNLFSSRKGINVSGTANRASSITTSLKSASSLDEVIALLSELFKDRNNPDVNGNYVSFEGIFKDAIINIRHENDIRKLAQELYALERGVSRGRGLVTT